MQKKALIFAVLTGVVLLYLYARQATIERERIERARIEAEAEQRKRNLLAEQKAATGQNVILVRDETTPEDFHGIVAAKAVLTSRGGMTSHAAVVARGMGKCAVVGCKDVVVPESEQQLVSACLMTRVNTRGIHFPLSLTGPGIGATANELISHRQLLPASAFFGNLWKSPHYSQDATTAEGTFPGNEGTAGGQWKNSEKFVCNFSSSIGFNTTGMIVLGRECEANGCDHVSYLGGCMSNRKRKVTDPGSASYQQPAAPTVNDSTVAGGMYTSTLTYNAAYRGLTYSPIYVAEPAVMDFESGLSGPPLTGPA